MIRDEAMNYNEWKNLKIDQAIIDATPNSVEHGYILSTTPRKSCTSTPSLSTIMETGKNTPCSSREEKMGHDI